MNILIFDTQTALAEAAATLWAKKIWDNTELRVCLPGGKTPEPLYRKMIDFYHEGQVCFRDMEVFLLDEFGGLQPNARGSIQQMVRNNFLDWIDFPAGHLQTMDPNAEDPDAEIARYDELFAEPMDLTLLGLGKNGHLGMNEPGSLCDSPTRRVSLTQASINSAKYYFEAAPIPTWGVTVGMKRILESKEIWLMATGSYKAPILKRILSETPSQELPASWLRTHPNVSLFVDRDAAAKLFEPAAADFIL